MPISLSELEREALLSQWNVLERNTFQNFAEKYVGVQKFVTKEPSVTFWHLFWGESHGERYTFPEFLSCVAAGKQGYSLGEYWQIGFPDDLREEFLYDGYIMFWPPDFSSEPEEFPVRIDHFCFAVKVAAVFYAEHIDEDFDPWPYFPAVDRFCLKYSDPATFNKEE